MRIQYAVSPQDTGLTLSDLLRKRLHLSTAQRIACLRAGGVTVDGAAFFANQRPPLGAVVVAELPDPAPVEVPAEPGALRILYEDEALLAVFKPAGMLVHPSASQYAGTLLGRVLGHLRETKQPLCAHPIHRLDRGTSGIVLFAKHPHVHARAMAAMRDGAVRKRYEAFACGAFPADLGEIDAPIARAPHPENPTDPRPSQRRIIDAAGQAALTRYRALERLSVHGLAITRVALEPVTGRTHQLRAHCLHIGCPLLGDALYHTPKSLALSRALGLDAQLLCAAELSLPHPLTGAPLRISVPGFAPAEA